jgi:hypothetical protein
MWEGFKHALGWNLLLPKSGFEFSNKQGTTSKLFFESQRIVEETNDTVLRIYIHTMIW